MAVVVASGCDFLNVGISGTRYDIAKWSVVFIQSFISKNKNFSFMSTLSLMGANETPILL